MQYEVRDTVATLTLDSPHNRNAITAAMIGGLHRGLADAAADPTVRVVVLTHTGGTFCAGADLADTETTGSDRARAMIELLRAMIELPKPVVGKIDGHVRAGGMGLLGACDIVIAGPASTFALTEARLGLAAAIISLTVLPRLTSRAASRYFLTGETFGPVEAERLGLVTMATDNSTSATDAVVTELRKSSPQGIAESKALTTREMLAGFDAHTDAAIAQSTRLFDSAEAREGMTAFRQRRDPSWYPPPQEAPSE